MIIDKLIGKTLAGAFVTPERDRLILALPDGLRFVFYHEQDCCESVTIDDIAGDLSDLVGSPILQAEENTSKETHNGKPGCSESFTWTFYRFTTAKGQVVVKWLGESNGYYSEGVSMIEVYDE